MLTYSPLAAGILTGKYQQQGTPAPGTRMADPRMGAYLRGRTQEQRTLAVLEATKKIAEDNGATMSQVALAWLVARPAVTSVILGARTLDQLVANLATDLRLSADETALLDAVSDPAIDFPYGGVAVQQFARRVEGGW